MIVFRSQISEVRRQIFLFSVLCFLFSVLYGCQRQHLHKDSQLMMGTTVEIISPDRRAAGIVFKEIKRIEDLLSIYKAQSEVFQLNRQGRIKASPDTLFVIKKAGEFWKATQGAFDITIAPIVQAWGFYDKSYRVINDSEIKKLLNVIGFDKLRIDGNIIEFKAKGMMIDLGAIAKGFAVDCAVVKLKLAGIKSALVNAGGDIYCLGDKQGKPWRVAIKKGEGSDFGGYLELRNKAVASSGNYEQHFFIHNERYCHILNPKTGRPADSGIVSVTVIADDCLTADALTTSIFVLGEREGKELAKRFNAKVKIYADVK